MLAVDVRVKGQGSYRETHHLQRGHKERQNAVGALQDICMTAEGAAAGDPPRNLQSCLLFVDILIMLKAAWLSLLCAILQAASLPVQHCWCSIQALAVGMFMHCCE
jgi:hypothetical protein